MTKEAIISSFKELLSLYFTIGRENDYNKTALKQYFNR